MREILGGRAKPEKKLHQSHQRGCVLWYDDLPLDRGLEDKDRTEVGYDIFSLPEYKRHLRPSRPRQNQTQHIPRLHPARLTTLQSTVPQTGPLLQTVGIKEDVSKELPDLLRFVLFLYMIRCPHSRQRMGSRGLMSFLAPQSSVHYQHTIIFAASCFSPAHKYSISCLGGGKSCVVAAEWGCC